MQRPEEKKHPSTLDPQEFLYHGLGLAVFGDEQVTGTRSSSPRTRLFLTATPWLRQRIGLPGRRHGGAGMEACIAKGGCKGYISAGSRPRRMASSPATSWVWLGGREVFFSRLSFSASLLASSQITPFFLSDCILSFSGLFLFNKKLLGGWRWSTVGGKGGEGVLGERNGGMLFYSHTFSLLSMGPRLSPCCRGGVPKRAPSTKIPAKGAVVDGPKRYANAHF